MISFRQFIDEAILSKRQALRKLVKTSVDADRERVHLGKYQKQITTEPHLPNASADPISLKSKAWDIWTDRPNAKQKKEIGKRLENIPLDKVTTNQVKVAKHAVAEKITGSFKKKAKEYPRFPIFTKANDGTYEVRDGNHRTIARKIRGFTHIRGVVVDKE